MAYIYSYVLNSTTTRTAVCISIASVLICMVAFIFCYWMSNVLTILDVYNCH